MAEKKELLSAGNIAKELGVPEAKVKRAIKDLGIEPTAKRGVCNLYSLEALARIKEALKSGG